MSQWLGCLKITTPPKPSKKSSFIQSNLFLLITINAVNNPTKIRSDALAILNILPELQNFGSLANVIILPNVLTPDYNKAYHDHFHLDHGPDLPP